MTKEEYRQYEEDVQRFFERELINNLTLESGIVNEEGETVCQICGDIINCEGEPSFSWNSCDCCGESLGGDRYHATGYHPIDKTGYCYEVCARCIYYAEYGRLDDLTMSEIEC